jgi:hypothetical protein
MTTATTAIPRPRPLGTRVRLLIALAVAALPGAHPARQRVIAEPSASTSGDADLAQQLANPTASLMSLCRSNRTSTSASFPTTARSR